MVEPQKDSALRTYYGYYVDSCDPPGEITPPSRLVVGSIGERKGAHVWGVPGTIRQKPEAAIQPTPTKPVKVPPLAQLPAIQATPTKSEKVTPLAQLPSYGHVTIRSANCAVLMNGPQQPGALCAECTDTKRFLQKKANKQKDPRKPASTKTHNSRLSPDQMEHKVELLKRGRRNAERRCERLVKSWCASLEDAPPSQVQEIHDLHMTHKKEFFEEFSAAKNKDSEYAEVMRAVWADVEKSITLQADGKSTKAMRYSPLTLKWCLARYLHGKKSYPWLECLDAQATANSVLAGAV